MHVSEPGVEEFLDTPLLDLNIAKLRPSTNISALPEPTVTANFTAMAMQINEFLKLMLDDILMLPRFLMDESIPV
uniref:Uncharacterized protein n=1 Tax=Romanomermis culicivorax TaxID=13658 RepID=A0A915I1Z5_ROMCU